MFWGQFHLKKPLAACQMHSFIGIKSLKSDFLIQIKSTKLVKVKKVHKKFIKKFHGV
jgi:hypothetical protein